MGCRAPAHPERVALYEELSETQPTLYLIARTCRLREGEFFGLMDADVDLDRRTVRVERQLMRMRDGSGLDFPEPKHGRERPIKLPTKALDVLADHRERQACEARQLKSLYNDMGLLFASQRGTPLDASNVINRSCRRCSSVLAYPPSGPTTSGAPAPSYSS